MFIVRMIRNRSTVRVNMQSLLLMSAKFTADCAKLVILVNWPSVTVGHTFMKPAYFY
jgi:hypothetical protein